MEYGDRGHKARCHTWWLIYRWKELGLKLKLGTNLEWALSNTEESWLPCMKLFMAGCYDCCYFSYSLWTWHDVNICYLVPINTKRSTHMMRWVPFIFRENAVCVHLSFFWGRLSFVLFSKGQWYKSNYGQVPLEMARKEENERRIHRHRWK